MKGLRKFLITSTVCGLFLFGASIYVVADNMMQARSEGNSAEGLPPELVISDADETDQLIVHNSLDGDFVVGKGNVINLGEIRVKNVSNGPYSYKLSSIFVSSNKPVQYPDPYAPSKMFKMLEITIQNEDGKSLYVGKLENLYTNSDFLRISAGGEQTLKFRGILRELDLDLVGEKLEYGIGVIKF